MPADPSSSRRWQILSVVALVVAVAALVVALVVARDDDDDVATTDSTTTTTSTVTTPTTPSPSSETTATTTPTGDTSTAVWPFADSDVRYDDPVDAALGFAEDFVGFTDPVAGEFQQGDARSGEVEIRPRADGPVTIVFVRQLTSDDTWWVLGSATASIQLTSPGAVDEISSPVALQGQSTAFEAVVGVALRADGASEPVATGVVMGGSMGEMGPFEGELSFERPDADAGALVLTTDSAENGQVWEASVVRIRFSSS